MSKKIISLLLAVILTISMVAVTAASVSASIDDNGCYVPSTDDTNRYYFYLPSDWCNDVAKAAGVYWWAGTDACSAIDGSNPDSPAWPGYKAQPSDTANVYYIDCPSDVGTIIWNNAFDGGEDPSDPNYAKAIQTANIACEYYSAGEAENYDDALFEAMETSYNGDKAALGDYAGNFFYDDDTFSMTFDNMIYVVDPNKLSVGEIGGKQQYGGEWYFYYGNGEYGTYPVKADGKVFNTEYQPPKNGAGNTDATTQQPETTLQSETKPDSETTAAPETTVAQVPFLTVNATSNFFPEATAYYNEDTKEVAVTYSLQSSKDVLNDEWILKYDPEILALSSKNSALTVSPVMGTNGSQYNLTDIAGEAHGVSSNLYLYNFSSEMQPFVTVVFDVLNITDKAPVNTTIDLDLKVLTVSKVGDDLQSNEDEEVTLVRDSKLIEDDKAKTVSVSTSTKLTESTFVPATAGNDSNTTETATAQKPTDDSDKTVNATPSPDATSAVGDHAVSTSDTVNGSNDNGAIQTGDASLALIVLTLLIAVTGVMFVIRKREMY